LLFFSTLFFFSLFLVSATLLIYILSLHDALPICNGQILVSRFVEGRFTICPVDCLTFRPTGTLTMETAPASFSRMPGCCASPVGDRKSTRLNSSHEWISYAVFCLKKKNIR